RKRRRLAVSLAVAVVVLVAGGGAVGLWLARDPARREAETAVRRDYLERGGLTAPGEAQPRRPELHGRLQDERPGRRPVRDRKEWQGLLESAQAASKRAEVLAVGGREMLAPELSARLAALDGQLQADERERRLASDLDRIRLETLGVADGQVRLRPAAPKLA